MSRVGFDLCEGLIVWNLENLDFSLLKPAFPLWNSSGFTELTDPLAPDLSDPEWLESFRQDCIKLAISLTPITPIEIPPQLCHGVKPAKVRQIGGVLAILREILSPSCVVVDVGGGTGALIHAINALLHVSTISIDASPARTASAAKRAEKLGLTNCQHITAAIPVSPDGLLDLLSPLKGPQTTLILVGLHACGDLTPTCLRAICSPKNVVIDKFVLIGCCYHLLTEAEDSVPLTWTDLGPTRDRSVARPLRPSQSDRTDVQFPLSNWCPVRYIGPFGRNLAQRVPLSPIHIRQFAFRAILHLELVNRGIPNPEDLAIGRLKVQAEDWQGYLQTVRASLKGSTPVERAVLDLDLELDERVLEERITKVEQMARVREGLAVALEGLIVRDREEFVREQAGERFQIELRAAFAKATSPRNLALVGFRRDQ